METGILWRRDPKVVSKIGEKILKININFFITKAHARSNQKYGFDNRRRRFLICEYFLSQSYKVICFDNFATGHRHNLKTLSIILISIWLKEIYAQVSATITQCRGRLCLAPSWVL
jgi:hypothetical protein